MEIVLLIIGLVFIILGLIGAVAPALPGPPLSYFGLIMLELAQSGRIFSNTFFIVLGAVTLAITIGDSFLPLIGVKLYGVSKKGIWGAAIGLFLGFIFMPLGLIVGPLFGAVIGEVLAGKNGLEAWRAGLATLAGHIASIVLKLGLAIVMAIYFFTKALAYY